MSIPKSWKVVNLDRMEYLDPESISESSHLSEMKGKLATALFLLVISPVGYAGYGGLLGGSNSAIGLWSGDRIAVVSEETEDGDIPGVHGAGSIYSKCIKRTKKDVSGSRVPTGNKGEFKNITGWVREAMVENGLDKIKDLPDVIYLDGRKYTPR